MPSIDDTLLASLESLACIRLAEEERGQMKDQLCRIIHSFQQLSPHMLKPSPPDPAPACLREDTAQIFPHSNAILDCAAQQKDHCIVVPKAVD